MFNTRLIGGGFHDEVGEPCGVLLGMCCCFQCYLVQAMCFPWAFDTVRVSGVWEILASFCVACWCHHVCHVFCEDGEDAHGVCVDDACFITDHGGATADRVVVEDSPVHDFCSGAEAAPECGFIQDFLCSLPIIPNVLQFLDGGGDLF